MKNFVAVLFVLLSLSAFSQIPDYVPSDGLAGWWEFDGGFDDRSGNGNHGIAEGSSPPILGADRHGDDDSALFLTGGGILNCGDDNSLRATSELSVSFWFLAQEGANNSNNAYHILLNKEGEYEFGFQSGTLYYAIDNSSPNWNWQTIAQNVPSDTWQHFAFTYDGSSIECFMNGIPVYSLSANGSIQDHHPDADALWLGNRPITDIPFVGALDEVGVWTTALSALEVLGLFENQLPVGGCTEPTSCNYDASADWDDGSCIPAGCEDEYACNYDATAGCDDGSCDYSCCPGPGCCGAGTTWNWTTSECDVANPSDSNFDGCVQLGDLLDLLSAYGTCAWQCGDPLNYQGYDYETVQIGEQCWFAENLRAENYKNGEAIDNVVVNLEWYNALDSQLPAVCNNLNAFCESNDCGMLYNRFAVEDERGVCPAGWTVPTDSVWMQLESAIGLPEGQLNNLGWRGTDQGTVLKSESLWNGTNLVGFNAKPEGYRSGLGLYANIEDAHFWSQNPGGVESWYRMVNTNESRIYRPTNANPAAGGGESLPRFGFSVRCVKDSE